MGNFESQLEGLISWALSFYRPNHSSYGISIAPILFIKICYQIFFPPFNITITLKCTKGCNLYIDQRMFIHDVYNFFSIPQQGTAFFPLGYDDYAYPFHFPDLWVKKENSQLDLYTFTDHSDNGKNCQRCVTTYYLPQGVLGSQAM